MTRSLALVLSCALLLVPALARAGERLRYATDGYGIGALTIIAAEEGFLAQEGIEPVVQTYAYGVDTVDAVLAGNADFGVVVDFALLPRLATGRLVSPAIIAEPLPGWHRLYVRSGIGGLAGLKGARMGIAAGTAQEFVTRIHLADNGLSAEGDVTLLAFASLFDIVGAMKAGRIDAAWVWGDGAGVMDADPGWTFVADDGVIGHTSTAFIVTSRAFHESRRALVVQTLRAFQRASEHLVAHPEASAERIAQSTGADAALVRHLVAQQRYGLSFKAQALASLGAKYDFLVAASRIEPFDLLGQLDASALAEAVPDADIAPVLQ